MNEGDEGKLCTTKYVLPSMYAKFVRQLEKRTGLYSRVVKSAKARERQRGKEGKRERGKERECLHNTP